MRKVFVPLTIGCLLSTLTTGAGAGVITSATTLHPGDRVSVNVFNHPELAVATTTVDSSGRISVPLAGLVPAANLTPGQVGQRITDRLVSYVRRPAVDVQVVSQGQNIFVTGGPGGVYPYVPGETLSGALAQVQQGAPGSNAATTGTPATSGNPISLAAHNLQAGSIDLKRVFIERDGRLLPPVDAQQLAVAGDPGPSLQPGDTIRLVDKAIAVPVGGQVGEPGVAHLDVGEPISDALRQVGGAEDPSSSVAFVLKRDNQDTLVTTSSPEYTQPARAGDSIYVPHAVRVGVVGMVEKPGDVVLRGDHSLLSAMYYAGGPTKWGNIKSVSVMHQGVAYGYDVTRLTHGAPAENPQLSDGDTVFVPEGHKIDFSLVFSGIYSLVNVRALTR